MFSWEFMNNIKNRVLKCAQQVADEQRIEIFDIELLGRGRLLLRITIDKDEGITIDDCERFSRSLEALLDVEDVIHGPYTLEVSSPGIDRPLRNIKDFEKNRGKLIRIVTVEEIENRNFFIGRIIGIHDSNIRVFVNEREIEIPFEKISNARIEVEFK